MSDKKEYIVALTVSVAVEASSPYTAWLAARRLIDDVLQSDCYRVEGGYRPGDIHETLVSRAKRRLEK